MESDQRQIREEDRRHEEWLMREQKLTIRAMVLTIAVCIAPFLMLPFGLVPALVVLGVGLLFTAWLCWSASGQVGAAARAKLRTAGALNFVMALVVFVVAWVLYS
jgi:hypothetical protein